MGQLACMVMVVYTNVAYTRSEAIRARLCLAQNGVPGRDLFRAESDIVRSSSTSSVL